YFEDKEDLFFFILETLLSEKLSRFVPTLLQAEPLDLFGSYRAIFELLLTILDEPKYYPFFASVYRHINSRINAKIMAMIEKFRAMYLYQDNRFQASDNHRLLELIAIMGLIHRDLLEQKVAEGWSKDQTMSRYDLRMSIVQEGYQANVCGEKGMN
ncbi:MAG: hypothetical protein V1761_00030, partial [bacterium]